jgi:hypothetical protein
MTAMPVHIVVDAGGRIGSLTVMYDPEEPLSAITIGHAISVFLVESADLA